MHSRDRTAAGFPASAVYPRRRALFFTLFGLSLIAMVVALGRLLAADGVSVDEILLLFLFAGTLPFTLKGFWSALIGLVVRAVRGPGGVRLGLAELDPGAAQTITGLTAIVMPVYNEDPEEVLANLRAADETLKAAGGTEQCDLWLLSDSRDPAIVAEEKRRFADWRAGAEQPGRLHYRHRPDNVGKKNGNLWDFLDQHGDEYRYVVVLDADSVLSGETILAMVRVMEANPQIGILQSIGVGLPTLSPFSRIFQFGLRFVMRTFVAGATWWQGDCGPHWGHNEVIRIAAFRRWSRLPVLPGKPPIGGWIMSHDLAEGAWMRGHGSDDEVRVIPMETGTSFESHPPTLPGFLKRECRWAQGAVQYAALIGRPNLRPMGRMALFYAMCMYSAPLFWMGFVALATLKGAVELGAGVPLSPNLTGPLSDPSLTEGLVLLGVSLFLVFFPKMLGLVQVLLSGRERRAFGGGLRLLAGAVVEFVFSMVTAPIIAFSLTLFLLGLPFGRVMGWDAQKRQAVSLSLAESVRFAWPHTLVGGLAFAAIAVFCPPLVLYWTLPVLLPLMLAVPITWLTAWLPFGRWLGRIGLCAVPEEIAPPTVVALSGAAGALQPGRAAPPAAPVPAPVGATTL